MTKATGSMENRTFSLLRSAAVDALERAGSSESGRFYQCMHALISSAFCLEAYLNHVGEHENQLWKENPRLNVWDKFRRVCKEVELTPDYSARPFSTFEWLVDFRDSVAHARTEVRTFSASPVRDGLPMPEVLQSAIEKAVTLETATTALR